MKKIDAHIHYAGDTPAALQLLEDLDLKMLNIGLVVSESHQWRDQVPMYGGLAKERLERFAWCTTFDLPRFDDPQFIEKAILQLDADFEEGAIACKVWKNIGMEVRSPSGEFFMPDDPFLDPIYDHIASRNKTLLMHIAEPLGCWQPLDPKSPHYSYYSQNPEWHMYGKSGVRSHEELIAARDRVAEKHPNLRVVGAHIGSLEYDVYEAAKRFDRYPNFAIDTSARLLDMALQDSEKVRQFFLDYQDRILFGTDIVSAFPMSALSAEKLEQILARYRDNYLTHFRYFETDDTFDMYGREVKGIGLPPEVLEKVYYRNAVRWYPGVD